MGNTLPINSTIKAHLGAGIVAFGRPLCRVMYTTLIAGSGRALGVGIQAFSADPSSCRVSGPR